MIRPGRSTAVRDSPRPTTRRCPVIEVLVADDHAFFRAAVVDLLTGAGDTAVVAECSDGAQVLPAYHRVRRDVVLLDMAIPGRPAWRPRRRC
jgi:DNA-binding NarL/FixJ family response regulator